jgi:hypothetical protein
MDMKPILSVEGGSPVGGLKKGDEVLLDGRPARVESFNDKQGVAALRFRRVGKTPASIAVVAIETREGAVHADPAPVMVFPTRKGAFPREAFSVVEEVVDV